MSDLQRLESMLDSKKAGNKHLGDFMQYRTQLEGWTPQKKPKNADLDAIEPLDLGSATDQSTPNTNTTTGLDTATNSTGATESSNLSGRATNCFSVISTASQATDVGGEGAAGGDIKSQASLGKQEADKEDKNSEKKKNAGGRGGAGGSGGGRPNFTPEQIALSKQKKEARKAAKLARQKKAAERRAAQAAGKSNGSNNNSGGGQNQKKPKNKNKGKKQKQNNQPERKAGNFFGDPKQFAKNRKRFVGRTLAQKQVDLFSHLAQYERETSLSLKVGFSSEEMHPAILRLGLKYANGTIVGANSRTLAMLEAFKEFIADYKCPSNALFSRDLSNKLKPLIRFLDECRRKSISMGNCIRHLKAHIVKLPTNLSEAEAKVDLLEYIDSLMQERIQFADTVISSYGVNKINDGDVILTYARSSVVEQTLKCAYDQGKHFRVIVVDSRPKLEGKITLRNLTEHGIKCTYVYINALSYVMKDVTKVFVGAHGILANGSVISRVGSAVVAMMAKHSNVPYLVCCETIKFHERAQLDSICVNELGDPDDLVRVDADDRVDPLNDWRDIGNLRLLNLTYDVTQAEFVSMIITEVGDIPATSVPVILREYNKA